MAWVNVEVERTYSGIIVLLVIAIFISAIAVIAVVNQSREFFNAYYRLQLVEQKYQDEHVRLLIDISNESTAYKILNLSKNQLNMIIPKASDRLYLP